MGQQPIELFMPPNMLKGKVGSGGSVDLAAAIKRAETAMEELKGEFSGMANDAVSVLSAAHQAYTAKPDCRDSRAALLRASLDIKGLAATFDFPLMARVAGALSRLLCETPDASPLPIKLVEAHVAAVQVIHRKAITGLDDKPTLALLAELESQVAAVLKPN